MPVPSDLGAAVRVRAPVILIRGIDNTTTVDARIGDAAATVTAATYKLYDGTTLLQQTVLGDLAPPSTTVDADNIPATLALGEGYREVWSLTVDGVSREYTRPVILARYAYTCPVTQADLTSEYPDLDAMLRTDDADSLQPFIDAAHADIVRMLLRDGVLPETLVDPDASFEATRELALYKVWRFASANLGKDSSAARLAADHKSAAAKAYTTIRSRLDLDLDGAADSDDRHPIPAVASANTPRRYAYGSGGFGRVI